MSCTSGREHLQISNDQKLKEQFRYNRIRLIPSEHPEHGHRPVSFLV
jgi:hypothetical protein